MKVLSESEIERGKPGNHDCIDDGRGENNTTIEQGGEMRGAPPSKQLRAFINMSVPNRRRTMDQAAESW
jgi:hypothetical protein